MRCVSTKNKSEKITFYFTFSLLKNEYPIDGYELIERNSTFHLIYSTIFCPFWFASYEGKTATTHAPVLSILNAFADSVLAHNGGEGLGL